MTLPRRLVLASGNAGKLRELGALLAPFGAELIAQSALGVDDAEETGLSFIENAILKARHAARATGLPALADDSGLAVDALDGAPGIYSARYAGAGARDADNCAKLLGALEATPEAARGARFHCVLALVRSAEDPVPLICHGQWQGRILRAPRGTNGFGYDPLFLPDGQHLSAAELDPATKNLLSHRARALAALRDALEAL